MATSACPYGLLPTRNMGSQRFPSAGHMFPVTKNVAAPIYWHSPVALIGGSVKVVAASPTTTAGVDSPVGVLNWAYWEDREGPHWSPMLPAMVVEGGSKTAWNVQVGINDDPHYCFRIQGTATMITADAGKTAAIVNPAAGNAVTGMSSAALGAPGVAVTAALRILRVLEPGDPFPDCLVQWNGGVHQYENGWTAAAVMTAEGEEEERKLRERGESYHRDLEQRARERKEAEQAERERTERETKDREQRARESEKEERDRNERNERNERKEPKTPARGKE